MLGLRGPHQGPQSFRPSPLPPLPGHTLSQTSGLLESFLSLVRAVSTSHASFCESPNSRGRPDSRLLGRASVTLLGLGAQLSNTS